jgi:beta-N-acetylhexosaminidase
MKSRYSVGAILLAAMLLPVSVNAQGNDLLRKKIGQMILVGFMGQTVSDTILADLALRNVGGVILSGSNGNLKTPTQIRQLTAQIDSVAITPPLIAVDQEGGLVARLNANNGFASTYTPFTLGTTFGSVDSTRKQAAMMAGWVNTCGMNLDFAPVVDVNVNPSSPAIGYYGRSFSANPAVVAAHARAFIDEFHARNIMTSLKHFPGHGSATTDSHLTLPDITATWSPSELIPYKTLLATGSVDMVMVGHLYNANMDSLYPTSLSRAVVQGMLRDSLGYNGVVITDDLYNMAAITNYFGFWDAAERSINAGADILLYVSNLKNGNSLVRVLIDTLEAKVRQGRITEIRINEAANRISQLKNRFLPTRIQRPALSTSRLPADFGLSSFPNPFNPSTTVRFKLPVRCQVQLDIYNALGQKIARLANEQLEAGWHERIWFASQSSGVYFARIVATSIDEPGRNFVDVKKMMLLK